MKAKFQGVNESILGRIADKLGKTITNAEQITTAIEGVTFQQVLESYGDSRATEAQQTAVRNYETKYGLKDGAKIDQQKPKEDKQDDVPAWAQSILDANKQLSEEKQEILNELIFRIQAVQAAEEKKYVLMNVPTDKIDAILEVLPGIKSPTIMPLATEGWSSIHTVLDQKRFWDIIGKLKAIGAQGILVLPIEKMII